MISTCFFDLDLTLIDSHGALYEGLEAVLDPNNRKFNLVILTGRGFPRYREVVSQNPVLASRVMPVALEHGARIINAKNENIHYVRLPKTDKRLIIDYILTHTIHSVSFYPENTQSQTILWSENSPETLELSAAFTTGVTYVKRKEDLFRAFEKENPCTITVRSPKGLTPFRPEGLHYYTRGQNINFVPPGVNKGKAAQIIAQIKKIPLTNALAAGNDHNDLPLLTLPALAVCLFVGTDLSDEDKKILPAQTVYVPDPRMLGMIIKERTNK